MREAPTTTKRYPVQVEARSFSACRTNSIGCGGFNAVAFTPFDARTEHALIDAHRIESVDVTGHDETNSVTLTARLSTGVLSGYSVTQARHILATFRRGDFNRQEATA